MGRAARQLVLGPCLSLQSEAGITGGCRVGSRDVNSGPHALTTEPSPQPKIEFSDSKRV